ncbi:trypsin-like peptidase domain-containing protein [Bacillus toyonensis]|uniref:trypsin-like peptidase domain-containing protein n=1 Tax=Bacillus toyonensis TaxID=155322 RepID=UPI0002795D87|nr:trypsin-like peptidase domain-containing protein [Bacillus toyonensis]EJQ72864.1 hypothetical protein IGK_05531 [Bacillus toyonensis]
MKQIIIEQEELLKLFKEFIPWSGRHLVRLFEMKAGLHPLGSGGLLKYKDRYFVLTNAHVIKDVEDKNDIRIPYTINNSQTYSMKVIDIKFNVPDDIAILEVSLDDYLNRSNYRFLDSSSIDTNLKEYTDNTNILYLHGYPSGRTNIEQENKEVDMETLPYCTFVAKYDDSIGSLLAFIDDEVTTEHETTIPTPVVSGMSGSFVYGYYLEEPKFKLIGVLTNWYITDKRLEIYPIQEFIDYIDQNCFSNN